MQKNVVGISEEKIDKLIIEITEYANKINKIFNQASELVDKTKTYYISESGDKFREKYLEFSDNYKTFNQNILSYAKELTVVKKKYSSSTEQIIANLNLKKTN